MDFLIAIDHYLFGLINGQWTNGLFDFLLPLWRTKTTWIPLYAILLFFIIKQEGKKTFWILVVIAITILIADQMSSEIIKKTVMRLRPCREPLLDNANVLVHCGGGYSFTSSHATNHFALAMQLFLLFRKSWKPLYFNLLWLWAALIAYAQVYVGVHYPLDVVAGALLGMSIAYLVALAAKKLNHKFKLF